MFSNCPMELKGPLKDLEMHLLSPRARRGPPGRRYAHGRAGRAFVYGDCSVNCVQRKWGRYGILIFSCLLFVLFEFFFANHGILIETRLF